MWVWDVVLAGYDGRMGDFVYASTAVTAVARSIPDDIAVLVAETLYWYLWYLGSCCIRFHI
jgi:hypothetical protein